MALTQEDDEEGAEAKTTTASQVKMKIKSSYCFEQSRVSSSLCCLCTFRSYANCSLKMASIIDKVKSSRNEVVLSL